MFTKSKCPSVAHWAFTVAPSCSISLLTSRMRCGLFLTVWTPSGVSVESMMKVGMERLYRTATLHAMLRSPTRALAALAAVAALPAAAQAATLQPIKPCYVSVTKEETEKVVVAGSGFTPHARVDISIDGNVRAAPIAGADGTLGP